MKIETIQFDDVRYNPERSAFETLVRLYDSGEVYSYPCQFSAPLHADFARVAQGLADTARKAHKSRRPVLRSRRVQVMDTSAPARPQSLLNRLLGHVAA